LSVVDEEPQLDLVRVEKSLHSLGFFASTATRELSRTIVQTIRRGDGQKVQAKAVIEGVQRLGLPTTSDRDKYMAFMKLALDKRFAEGELSNPVCFSGAEMIKLLGLRKGGFHYDEINEWCRRMVATTIMSQSSIFLADRRQYASDTFHVFERVVLVGEVLANGTRSEHYQVYLSQWQLQNLNLGYFLPLDFNAYLCLSRDIAKAMFGQLSVWFYASRGQPVEKNYRDLCQLLNIRAYPHISKARGVLEPSMRELVGIGYLSEWELTRSSRSDDFKLVLYPGDHLLNLPQFASIVNAEARASLEASLPGWVPELVKRGVSERKARQLAMDVEEQQPVEDQIEYAGHLIDQDRRKKGKITNPAGFFIWVIEENISVPDDFETSRRRRQRETLRLKLESDQAGLAALQFEYDEHCRALARKAFENEYHGERLESCLREQLAILKGEQPHWFTRVPENIRREVALGRLQKRVREEIKVLPFDEWSRKKASEFRF
jgi:hypothetical protein